MAWAPDYCTAAELKAYVRIGDTADDTQVALAIAAASRAVDRFCSRNAMRRQFGLVASAEARYYTAHYDDARLRWVVEIDDLMTTTGFAFAVDSNADYTYSGSITAYDLKPMNAAARAKPWTELVVRPTSTVFPTDAEDMVKVTAKWGWTSVPDPVKQATLLQASRLLSRRDSPYGIAGSPETGSEMRLLAKVDPDVEVALVDFKRKQWAFA